MESHNVNIRDAIKLYGDFKAVAGITLDIKKGEFFTLLGPSGCGKTTLLRMIAGFNTIDSGTISFGENIINNVPAHKRGIGMVFQNYAIFPHLTVSDNVAYGLKAQKVPGTQIGPRVKKALEMVQIEALANRKPNELSGGQQQRVALARAFVIEPSVLLMDEPLSNLDAKLRVQMRTTIKKLQRRLGITTIYVTHDQEEALSISDRIAVMKDGLIMQVGEPTQIYKKPENAFVAGFIGVSNFLDCTIRGGDPLNASVSVGDYTLDNIVLAGPYTGKGKIAARPEYLTLGEEGIKGRIELSTFLGDFIEYEIALENGQTIQLNEYTKDALSIKPDGMDVLVGMDASAVIIYGEGGEVLT
ncbi:MAG: ABC transporter ATP-binding protein [Eubacteriales bacterium]|jgi:iron(III) transport system ATP-binding protein|nr:ABC transporter ATP-binding protein [Eubacteriales bacterium]MDD4710894.1 ABC transporter ATP-binding protein [Eubacteriales bacterium]NLO14608.1 ABC transporter ATP-binding protein [Clostridiales bacterium]